MLFQVRIRIWPGRPAGRSNSRATRCPEPAVVNCHAALQKAASDDSIGDLLRYLTASIVVTVWVARTLHTQGRIFLVTSFHGNGRLADAVNDLLVVGFYLINFGYVALALKYGAKPSNLHESIEFLATKIGLVMVILGAMHSFNLVMFTRISTHRPHRSLLGESPFRKAADDF